MDMLGLRMEEIILFFATGYFWVMHDEPKPKSDPKKLPPIETTWEVAAEYLVPFMRGKGYVMEIREGSLLSWLGTREVVNLDGPPNVFYAEIKNDNLALAACEAFMEVNLNADQ